MHSLNVLSLIALHPRCLPRPPHLCPFLLTIPICLEVVLTHILVTCVAMHAFYTLVRRLLTWVVVLTVAFGGEGLLMRRPDITTLIIRRW